MEESKQSKVVDDLQEMTPDDLIKVRTGYGNVEDAVERRQPGRRRGSPGAADAYGARKKYNEMRE